MLLTSVPTGRGFASRGDLGVEVQLPRKDTWAHGILYSMIARACYQSCQHMDGGQTNQFPPEMALPSGPRHYHGRSYHARPVCDLPFRESGYRSACEEPHD